MRRNVITLLTVVFCGCGDNLLKPSGSVGIQPPLPAHTFLDDRLAACPSAAELAGVSDVRFLWDAAAMSGPLVCTTASGSADLTYIQERMYYGLILMKELRFDAALTWTEKPLYDWFRDLVGGISIMAGDGPSNCCSAGRVLNIFFAPNNQPKLNWVQIQNVIGGLIHEARHIEVGGHTCQGRYDYSVAQLGAFGVHNLFFTWIGTHSDPTVIPIEYRPYALYIACVQRGSAFCGEPKQTCS